MSLLVWPAIEEVGIVERSARKEKIMTNFVAPSVFLFFLWAPAFCQDAKLIEAARKEGGKIVAYGSSGRDLGTV